MWQNFFLILVNIVLVVIGQTLIKQGMNKVGRFSEMPIFVFGTRSFSSPLVLAGIGLYVLSTFVWLMLLSRVKLSVAYPSLSLGYILILLVSRLYLHETIRVEQSVGILLIIAGVFLVFSKSTM